MFIKGQVLYVITDSNKDNYQEISNILNTFNSSVSDITSPNISIENFPSEEIVKEYINNLPANALFAKNIFEDKNYFISLPLFSSHFSIPIKPGEYIWYFQDNQDNTDSTLKNDIRIKNFWVSRIHGTNISEDLNFSFYQRDFQKLRYIDDQITESKKTSREKQEDKQTKKLLEKSIKEINFEDNESFSDLTSDIDSFSIINNSNDNFKAFERYFSNNLDFSIQGSNNTLINLGRNIGFDPYAGAIDIVSGRNNLKNKKNVEVNSYESFNEDLEFQGDVTVSKDSDSSTFSIVNSNGFEENLKDPSFYFKNNKELSSFSNEDIKESILSLDNDASRIYVSENESIDSVLFYDNFFENQIEEISSESGPSILLKSNNIRIVARKEKEIDDENTVPEGSIRFIKESKEYDKYSHFLMENDGNIYLDAPKINIGSSSRNENDVVVSLCDSDNSEPLVLGETLKTKLEEILDEVVLALTTINIASAPLGADVTSYIANINVKKLELSEFLSKQVKTS